MFYNFLLQFVDVFSFLNVFKYITFRTGLAVFTSLITVLIIGGPFIKLVSRNKIVNPIRDDVLNCLNNKPSVLKSVQIGERIIDRMQDYIDVFVNDMVA